MFCYSNFYFDLGSKTFLEWFYLFGNIHIELVYVFPSFVFMCFRFHCSSFIICFLLQIFQHSLMKRYEIRLCDMLKLVLNYLISGTGLDRWRIKIFISKWPCMDKKIYNVYRGKRFYRLNSWTPSLEYLFYKWVIGNVFYEVLRTESLFPLKEKFFHVKVLLE